MVKVKAENHRETEQTPNLLKCGTKSWLKQDTLRHPGSREMSVEFMCELGIKGEKIWYDTGHTSKQPTDVD